MGRTVRTATSVMIIALLLGSLVACSARYNAEQPQTAQPGVPVPAPGVPEYSATPGSEGGGVPARGTGTSDSYGDADFTRKDIRVEGEAVVDSESGDAAERLVIRDKTLRLRVEDTERAVRKARALAAEFRGTVESVQLSGDQGPVYRAAPDGSQGGPLGGFVTIRIPAARFEAFVTSAAKLGRVLSESESAQDVTQQHVDLSARLRNLRAEAARLRALFERAASVTEMLKVERELSRVQGEIESMQAQVDYLERQAAMATVVLELVEPTPIADPREDWGVRQALSDSLRAFVDTFNGIIVLVGAVLPVAIVGAALLAPIVVLARRRKRRALRVTEITSEATQE